MQHSFTENTLGIWAYATIPVDVRERQKKYYGLISQIYFLDIGVKIGSAKPRSAAWFLIENRGRRQVPSFLDKTHITWE